MLFSVVAACAPSLVFLASPAVTVLTAIPAFPAFQEASEPDPGTQAIENLRALDPVEQEAVANAIAAAIDASKDPELLRLLTLRDRARTELPVGPDAPLVFFDCSVYAPAQVARSFMDPASGDAEYQYQQIRPWENAPPFNAVRVRYDFATNQGRASSNSPTAIDRTWDYLFGCVPENDVLVAWICWRLDHRKDLDALADHFGHAYCDRIGNCYSNLTLYDAYASQNDLEMPDADVIAFARHILHDDSFVSPIPQGRKVAKLYEKSSEDFLTYFRYRTTIEYLANLYVNPDGAMREANEVSRERYWTWFAKFESRDGKSDPFDATATGWKALKDRDAFDAKIDEWRKKDTGLIERAKSWRAGRNDVRWTVNKIATDVLKERGLWPGTTPPPPPAPPTDPAPSTNGGGAAPPANSATGSTPDNSTAQKVDAATAPKPTEETPVLNVGDKAPDFAIPDETGKVRTLAEFRGKTVVLWFYPKASTPGCTAEGCGFRDRTQDFENLGVVILGASFDTPEANLAFKTKQGFKYPLLCDTDKKLAIAYGAAKNSGSMWPDRVSAVIGPDGKIVKLYPKVNARTHFDEVLRDLGGTPPPSPPSSGGGFFRRLFGR